MLKKICIVTATRAEYGLLKPLIEKIESDEFLELELVVTGSHLSPEFGMTYKLIENDNVRIDEKIEILLSSDSSVGISKAMGLAMISFAEYFNRSRPDMVILLGDRFETFALASAALVANIPLAHLHGGEITEGAQDDVFRHCISKMSYLHFTSNEDHKNRVIQLGENPSRVFNVGAIGIENIKEAKLLTLEQLEDSIGFKLDKEFGLVTFHPETLGSARAKEQVKEVLSALDCFDNMKFIITKANADNEGREINDLIDEFVLGREDKYITFTSMGQVRYLSAMSYCNCVIGNSSSGIIEAPSFNIPTINIGDRQKGRLQSKTVINCKCRKEDIIDSIKLANNKEFRSSIKDEENPYGDGNVTEKILSIIKALSFKSLDNKKSFYDLNKK